MANATLNEVIEEIMGEISGVTGLASAPDYPPEKMADFPFAVGYVDSGVYSLESYGMTKGLHNVAIEVHVARKLLPQAVENLLAYADRIPDEMAQELFASTFTKFETFQQITYEFAAMEWGGVETLGIRFIIEGVKVKKSF